MYNCSPYVEGLHLYGSRFLNSRTIPYELLLRLFLFHCREARCRQLLNYTVHDKTDSGLTVQNMFSERQLPKREYSVPLSDVASVILPFIKRMKGVLQNPIRVSILV